MVSVYDYTDYRRFLKDRFSSQKKKNPGFSYRAFNRLAGLKSSGHLKLIIDSKRNLADDGIRMIARGFKMKEAERNYFELLVKFNQAQDNDEKNRYFKKLTQNKKFISAKPLTAAQYKLFSHWYYAAILEIIRIDTKEVKNTAWLRGQLNPSVPAKDIRSAVKTLKQLKLIREKKNDGLVRLKTMITSEDLVKSIYAANFHVEMADRAARSVLKDHPEDREFSSLTIVASEESFQTAKREIQKFRKKLHSILEQEEKGPKNIVSQINLHLFKLSKGNPEE